MKALQTIKGWSTTTKVLVGAGVVGAIALAVYMFKGSAKPAADAKGAKPGDPAKAVDPKVKAADDKAKKDHSDKVAAATATGGPGAQTPAGAVVGADASGNPIVAPADGSTAPAEGSAVTYIAPRNGNGKVIDPNTIEVRTTDALFANGQLVQLTTPQYNGQFTINGVWDSGDGTGSVFLPVPFNSAGDTSGGVGVPMDNSPGTITVLGDPSAIQPAANAGPVAPANQIAAQQSLVADASAPGVGVAADPSAGQFGTGMDSFEGMPGENSSMEFSYAFGSFFKNIGKKIGQFTKKELAGLANLLKGKKGKKGKMYIRLIPSDEAKRRVILMGQGKSKGLKGAALQTFIMKNK